MIMMRAGLVNSFCLTLSMLSSFTSINQYVLTSHVVHVLGECYWYMVHGGRVI